MNPLDPVLARMLRGDLAWDESAIDDRVRFLERARFHGVTALLHWARQAAGASWPAEICEHLRAQAAGDAALDLLRRRELARVLAVLATAGVRPVLLKGACLTHTLYPEGALRPSLDADLMIPPSQRATAFSVLRDEGYSSTEFQGGSLVNAQVPYWRELGAGGQLTLDVHWRISTSPLFAHVLEYEWLLPRAIPVTALGPQVLGAAPVDSLVHACLHRAAMYASPHDTHPDRIRTDRLIWLYDIHLLAGRLSPSGWSEVIGLARRHELRAVCRQGLEATARALATVIPDAVWTALAEPTPRPEPSATLLTMPSAWRLKRAELASLPSWAERARYLYETALPAPGYLFDRYQTRSTWRLPWLYVRRAIDRLQ